MAFALINKFPCSSSSSSSLRRRISGLFYMRTISSQSSSSTGTSLKLKNMSGTSKILPNIYKSTRDTRDYRGLELANKLKVLLISDADTDISAAAISVAAGSMHDPQNLPGLAHFCEHMLFLGTERYPEENEYMKFLSENGGSSNAYTAQDHTCYYFDVAPTALEPALDRFSQFFVNPLFTESGTEREVNAVNSEHQKNIPQDSWRVHQLAIHLANPSHPFSKFATGNLDTLWTKPREQNIDVRGALLKYYNECYSANVMSLAVFGRESLDELQELVEVLFTDISNKDLPLPKWTDSPYGPNELQTRISVVPVKDIRHLQVEFPIPDPAHLYLYRPEQYISHLIGHEGPGSLLSLLKKNHWVNNLSAGGMTLARGNGLFKILVDLTETGIEHTDEIILHIFQYLELLRNAGPQKWIWDETRDMGLVSFEYLDKQRPQTLVSGIASFMHELPVEHVISHGLQVAEYKPEIITDMLNLMTPEKCLVLTTSKNFESDTNLTEPYYGVKYSTSKLPAELLAQWKNCKVPDDLKLPEPNPLIPTAFDLKERDENTGTIPRLLVDTPMSRVWYLQDNEFQLPKGVVRVEFYSPIANESALAVNLNNMFRDVLKDLLTEKSYAAILAELGYDISNTAYGLDIVVKGYDHKLGVLLDMIMEQIVTFSLTQERFDAMKDSFRRGLKNWAEEQPYNHAIFYFELLLRQNKYSVVERIAAIDGVTMESLKDFVNRFVSSMKFEFLVSGNFTAEEALNLVHQCEQKFVSRGTQSLHPSKIVRHKEIIIPKGSNLVYEAEHLSHSSSCTATLFQTGLQSTRENVILDLINSISSEPFFNQLRTQEQLGYIVTSGNRRSYGTQGLKFLVQSERHPQYVDERIEDFIKNFTDFLKNMSEEDFIQHRASLVVKKSEKPKKISERALIMWAEISSQYYNFDRQAIEVAELETLEKDDIIQFFEEYIGVESKNRKRLSVHVIAKEGAGKQIQENKPISEQPVKILSPSVWKSGCEYYPLLTPTIPNAKL